ncbi:MAG: peptidase dimerization domain-containing protein, partial [bacterium]|nr:peptidase dimerization domain-containing protein [bacterium]
NDRHSGLFGGLIPNPALELSKLLSKIKINNDITFGGLRQTIEVSGLNSGYTGLGFKNIIPGKAEARLNIRTVQPQISKHVMKEVEEFIKRETPSYMKLAIESEVHGNPIFLSTEHAEIESIRKLLSEIHEKEVIHQHVGGSIPVVADFKAVLNKPMALVPLCNEDCNMHGVDENFSEYYMKKALEFTGAFWKKG